MSRELEKMIEAIEAIVDRRFEERLAAERSKAAEPSAPATYITIAEYAGRRSVGVTTVREAVRSGRLPAIKIGRALRVPADVEIGEPVTPKRSLESILTEDDRTWAARIARRSRGAR